MIWVDTLQRLFHQRLDCSITLVVGESDALAPEDLFRIVPKYFDRHKLATVRAVVEQLLFVSLCCLNDNPTVVSTQIVEKDVCNFSAGLFPC